MGAGITNPSLFSIETRCHESQDFMRGFGFSFSQLVVVVSQRTRSLRLLAARSRALHRGPQSPAAHLMLQASIRSVETVFSTKALVQEAGAQELAEGSRTALDSMAPRRVLFCG
jgi:hypothetical protein